MNRTVFLKALILFLLGMLGVASMLTMKIQLPADAAALLEARFTPLQIKFLLLINPSILLLLAVIVGGAIRTKTGLATPFIDALVDEAQEKLAATERIKHGLIGGAAAGVVITLLSLIYTPLLPNAFKALTETIQPNIANRLLYGGITEEILLRYGMMNLLCWLIIRINGQRAAWVYWTAIVLASIVFAIGHFPAVYTAIEKPSPLLISYILLGNASGGVIFGWLYWKKGLETAMLAHMMAHLIMVSASSFLPLSI